MIADPNAPPALTAEALTYSADTRCRCGAGLAYPADRAQRSRESWVCSRVLLGDAPEAEHDSFPFAFYEMKSEHTVNAYGATTRPPEAPRAAPRPKPPALPTIPDLARALFDAYNASTGGKTWDGKPVPPFDVIAQNTPHVARAWEAAARKAVEMIGRPVPAAEALPSVDSFTAPPGNPGARVIRTG